MTEKTDLELVNDCNYVAREFFRLLGYCAPADYKFYRSGYPRAALAWTMAKTAAEWLCGHEMDDAVDSVIESEDESEKTMQGLLAEMELTVSSHGARELAAGRGSLCSAPSSKLEQCESRK